MTDLSSRAGVVAQYGAVFARALKTRLELVYYQSTASAFAPLPDWYTPGAILSPPIPFAAAAEGRLDLMAAALRCEGFAVSTEVAPGSARQLTDRVADSTLAVIGSRSRLRPWPWARLWPSLLARLLGPQLCPVLVIPHAAEPPPLSRILYVVDDDASRVSTNSSRRCVEFLSDRLGLQLALVVPSGDRARSEPRDSARGTRLLRAGLTATAGQKGTLLVLAAPPGSSRTGRVAFEQMLRSSRVPVLLVCDSTAAV